MFEPSNLGVLVTLALRRVGPVAVAVVAFFVAPSAFGTTLPVGFTQTSIGGLSAPNSFEFTPDGRIFVCQQAGQIRVIDASGTLLATPFATLTVNSSGERGLLGLALDPNFATNNFLYVYYTATSPTIHNRISRLTANGNVMMAGSEVVLLDLNTLGATNHNGGCLRFGPDGKLYCSVGENANGSNAQNLTNLLGKILRINSDGSHPDRQSVLQRPDARPSEGDLGIRLQKSVAVHVSARVGCDLHSRRRREHLGGGRYRRRRRQLRLAWDGREPLHGRRVVHRTPRHL